MAKHFEKHQIEVLKSAFEESEYLTKEKKFELARVTGLDMEQVASAFNRMRNCKRARESMETLKRINGELTTSLQECQQREANLQKELEARKSRDALIETAIHSSKHGIAVPEGDLHFDHFEKFIDGYL